jgi:SAM-dependent methyltransferase
VTDRRPRDIGEFDARYQGGTAPWDIDRPQPALAAVADQFSGRFIDVGCGTGEHALLAAQRGLESLGLDAAPTAIERAKAKARDRALTAHFAVGDALNLAALGEQFDTSSTAASSTSSTTVTVSGTSRACPMPSGLQGTSSSCASASVSPAIGARVA